MGLAVCGAATGDASWAAVAAADWFALAMLLVSPFYALWRHFQHVRDMSDDIWNTGIRYLFKRSLNERD